MSSGNGGSGGDEVVGKWTTGEVLRPAAATRHQDWGLSKMAILGPVTCSVRGPHHLLFIPSLTS